MNFLRTNIQLFLHFLVEGMILSVWSITGIFFLYLVVTFLLTFFVPELPIPFYDTLFALSNRQLSMYLAGIFFLLTACIAIYVGQKRLPFITILDETREEQIVYLITSIYLSYFFTSSLNILRIPDMLLMGILFLYFILVLPLISEFFSRGGVASLKKMHSALSQFAKEKMPVQHTRNTLLPFSKGFVRSPTFRILRLFFLYGSIILISLMIISTIVGIVIVKSYDYAVEQRKIKESLSIVKLDPKVSTVGEKVVLKGFNFGFHENKKDRLMSSNGEITDLKMWVDNEIDFIIPLHWKEESLYIWIEKEKRDEPSKILKSNKVELNIISRWSLYPTEEETQSDNFYIVRIIKRLKRFYFLNQHFF